MTSETPTTPLSAPRVVGHVRLENGEVHIVPVCRDAHAAGLEDGQPVYSGAGGTIIAMPNNVHRRALGELENVLDEVCPDWFERFRETTPIGRALAAIRWMASNARPRPPVPERLRQALETHIEDLQAAASNLESEDLGGAFAGTVREFRAAARELRTALGGE